MVARREAISRSETVKGYEYAPDKYVVITDEDQRIEELRTARENATATP